MIQLSEEDRSGWRVVSVRGRADAESADTLEATLLAAIEESAKVASDLSTLDYVSSAGLRAFIQAARAAEARQGEFAICRPNPGVQRVFEMSGLQKILRIQGELPC
jgi:anti-anti-sigma factor